MLNDIPPNRMGVKSPFLLRKGFYRSCQGIMRAVRMLRGDQRARACPLKKRAMRDAYKNCA